MLNTRKSIIGKMNTKKATYAVINRPLFPKLSLTIPELSLTIPLAVMGGVLLHMLKSSTAMFTLLLTALALGILVWRYKYLSSLLWRYKYLSSKSKEPSELQESQAKPNAPIHVVDAIKHSNQKTESRVLLLVIFFLPIFTSGISDRLLDVGMRLAHIRQDRSTIWLKAPYSKLLQHDLKIKQPKILSGLTRFRDINILLSGFGRTTVFDFKNGHKVELMTVPNKSIIIGPRVDAWIPFQVKKRSSEAKPTQP